LENQASIEELQRKALESQIALNEQKLKDVGKTERQVAIAILIFCSPFLAFGLWVLWMLFRLFA
jgi:hypothetical protein